MPDISNTMIRQLVDQMASVAKDELAAYTSTVDLFDKMVKEQNPDDLSAGVTAAETTDDGLEAGTTNSSKWSSMITWLNNRSSSAGSADLNALIVARDLRMPQSFDDYIWFPTRSSRITDDNLFPDTAVTLGEMLHGGTFSGSNNLASTVDFARGAAVVSTGTIGGSSWSFNVGVTYADGSSGTEPVVVTNGSTSGTSFDLGKNLCSALSAVDTTTMYLGLGTTGLVAGHKVLVIGRDSAVLVATGADAGQADIYVAESQVGDYDPGDPITLRDDNSNENLTIQSINYETGVITCSTNLASTYTVADNGFIYLQTAVDPGFQEVQTVASVSAATSITFSGALQHTYFTGAYCINLVDDATAVTTVTGGAAGDSIYIQAVPDRTITQA